MQDRIVDGLSRLEYRGYDSAGVAIMSNTRVSFNKVVGKLANLKTELARRPLVGRVGIGDAAKGKLALPDAPDAVMPFLHAVAVQIVPYFAALAKGTDLDQPKNLAKSVTVV